MDSARDAARHADSMAEKFAEDERAYQTAWQAGSLYDYNRKCAADIRANVREILKERRKARGMGEYPALCAALKDLVRNLLCDMASCRADMRKLAEGNKDDLYFYPGDKRLREAFCEGAGLSTFPA